MLIHMTTWQAEARIPVLTHLIKQTPQSLSCFTFGL